MPASSRDVTATIEAHSRGDSVAGARLKPLVYDELLRIAARCLRGERAGHSLQPADLVHEAYIRLVDLNRINQYGKTHFRAIAARQMRRILVDHARKASAQKRGGRPIHVTLQEDAALAHGISADVLALEQALSRLAENNARPCQVAELRFFAGMDVKEVASVLGVHPNTVKNDWRFARAWLARELSRSVSDASSD